MAVTGMFVAAAIKELRQAGKKMIFFFSFLFIGVNFVRCQILRRRLFFLLFFLSFFLLFFLS